MRGPSVYGSHVATVILHVVIMALIVFLKEKKYVHVIFPRTYIPVPIWQRLLFENKEKTAEMTSYYLAQIDTNLALNYCIIGFS